MDNQNQETEQRDESQEQTDEFGLPEAIDKKKQRRKSRFSIWKWLFLIFFIIYFIITAYRIPLFVQLGKYLIVEHEPQKSDLIVCLGGPGVANSLAAVDAFQKGLAPYLFKAKEVEPDGFDYLKAKIRDYPTEIELFATITDGYGIPREAIISPEKRVGSTIEEANLVRTVALDKGYKSLILVTSLTHSRRAFLTFRKVFKDSKVKIISLPSHYQRFSPKDWCKNRRFTKEVIIEYQKMIYYKFRYGI
jgi:uncharacterized SAM-binding protein YcdF (DUF218 family)